MKQRGKSQQQGIVRQWVNRFLRLPRLVRMLVIGLFAIALTLTISPVVDQLYLNAFYSPSTTILPSIVSTFLGAVMYVVGWRLFISVESESGINLRFAALYLSVGLAVLFLSIFLIMIGINIGNANTF